MAIWVTTWIPRWGTDCAAGIAQPFPRPQRVCRLKRRAPGSPGTWSGKDRGPQVPPPPVIQVSGSDLSCRFSVRRRDVANFRKKRGRRRFRVAFAAVDERFSRNAGGNANVGPGARRKLERRCLITVVTGRESVRNRKYEWAVLNSSPTSGRARSQVRQLPMQRSVCRCDG
jgi:hypothetical protein